MAEEIMRIQKKLEWLMPKENVSRVKMKERDRLIIYADIHKMGCREAGQLISNIIAIVQDEFTLRIVHGFNHGISLKDMFNRRFENKRIVMKGSPDSNPGITDYIIGV